MRLNEYLKELRSKYQEVSPLKELASKKGNVLYQISYKNKREQRVLLVVDKKKKIISKEKIKKDLDIKAVAISFKRNLERYIQEVQKSKKIKIQQSQTHGVRDLKVIDEVKKKIAIKTKQKAKKLQSNCKFKSKYQERDALYIYFVFKFLREHLLSDDRVRLVNNELVLVSNNKIDEQLLKILKEISGELVYIGVRDDTCKKDLLDNRHQKIFNIVMSKNNQNEDMYFVLAAMYMLQHYKYEVKFKSLNLGYDIDWDFVNSFLESLEEMLYKENEELAENSAKVAKLILKEIYDIDVATKKEAKEILSKLFKGQAC